MQQKLNLILLFDIDGTLIKTGHAGKKAMFDAFSEILNITSGLDEISFAGSTDTGIYHSVLKNHSHLKEDPLLESRFRKCYLEHLAENLKNQPQGQEILPGITDFLQFLQTQKDIFVSLVTGNYREGAKIKLKHFQMAHHFSQGAFGCDFADRNLLPPLAIKRIQEDGYILPPKKNIWVIGDTVKDVLCAKSNDLPSLITLTGFSTREEILNAKPELTLETLENFQEFLKIAKN